MSDMPRKPGRPKGSGLKPESEKARHQVGAKLTDAELAKLDSLGPKRAATIRRLIREA